MLKVRCVVFYPDSGEQFSRVIDWDDPVSKKDFAIKADFAIREGGKVTTQIISSSCFDNETPLSSDKFED
jgi:hypothetical protein